MTLSKIHPQVASAICAPPEPQITASGSSPCVNHPTLGSDAATQLKNFLV